MIYSFTLGMVVPGLMFSAGDKLVEKAPAEKVAQEQVYIPVLMSDGKLQAMGLESYISRVVLGEMPAYFDEEALKAQAVAARTYTLRLLEDGDRHQGAVCTDYTCCQSYLEPEEYLRTRGAQSDMDKIFAAVADTAGEVVCYDGELICATYFASAGGATEDAKEVWGQSVPYLVPVSSPEQSLYDGQKVTCSAAEFQSRLGVSLEGNPDSWFGAVTYTPGGGVDTLRIGGKAYSGVKLRSLFGLRSTVFWVTATESAVTFETLGYGHRVGLSQYGADAMAQSGSDYRQILAHYYQGTTLERYTD